MIGVSSRDPESSEHTVTAQLQAIVRWGTAAGAGFARLERIWQPVLVVNGKHDVMVPTVNSYVLFEHLPNAKLILYPDSGHGASSSSVSRSCGKACAFWKPDECPSRAAHQP